MCPACLYVWVSMPHFSPPFSHILTSIAQVLNHFIPLSLSLSLHPHTHMEETIAYIPRQLCMAQEEVGLALGLSLGSGHHQPKEQPPSQPCAVEPSLTLSLPADGGLTAPGRPLIAAVKRELRAEDDEEAAERALYSAASSAAADDDEGCNSRKKLRLTKEQSALLEDRFKEHSTLNPKQKVALARQLNLRPRQVEVWFQNRRARTKLKQTEVDCEVLKRCFETLTEENRRLHRELQQLRALNHPHPAGFFMSQLPAATLSICPSCERVAGPPPAVADRPTKAAGPAGQRTSNSALSPTPPPADPSVHP